MLGKMKPGVPAHPVNIKVSETLFKYGSTIDCCSLHCTPAALLTTQPFLSVHFPIESSVRNNMCYLCSTVLHTETPSLVWCRLWDIIRLWAWIPLYIETGRNFYVLYHLYVVCCVVCLHMCVVRVSVGVCTFLFVPLVGNVPIWEAHLQTRKRVLTTNKSYVQHLPDWSWLWGGVRVYRPGKTRGGDLHLYSHVEDVSLTA